ncbi:MAG: hypothetical protein Q9221_003598 [Calogaya cf. arnoldii]
MHISPLAAAILAAIPMISALDYCAFSSTTGCNGPAFCCSDGGAVCCGGMPAGFGYSAQFDRLPQGTQGQGYFDSGCSKFAFRALGPGTECWKGGGKRVRSINWFHSAGSRVKARQVADAAANATECSPYFFSYLDKHGSMREVKVDNAEHAEVLAKQYEEGNLEALQTVEEYEGLL